MQTVAIVTVILFALLLFLAFYRYSKYERQHSHHHSHVRIVGATGATGTPGIQGATGGGSSLLMASGTLTSAQVKTLFSAPTVVVPAVPGKVLVFVSSYLRFIPGSVPYITPSPADLQLAYLVKDTFTDSSAVTFTDTSVNFLTSTTIRTATEGSNATNMGDTVGLPFYLRLSISGADPTTGNGTLQYVVYYVVSDPVA